MAEQKKNKAQDKAPQENQGVEVSQAQINQWKEQHGDVWLIETEDGKKCYLKKPDRATLGAASKTAKDDPMKFNEVILQNCWLDGDKEILTNDDDFMAVSTQLDELVTFKKAEVKKL